MTELTQNLELKAKNYNLNLKTDLKNRAYRFSVELIKAIDGLSNSISSAIIVKQLIRSATSIGANIIEAKGSSSRRDFINYYHIALKSANETEYWLKLLKEAYGLNDRKIDQLILEVTEIARMLASSIITLKGKR